LKVSGTRTSSSPATVATSIGQAAAERGARSRRARRPRGSLTPELILDAAEALAAAQGFAALSMRAVAARLGAVPMALYNHFATKEQLVDALLDRVLGRFRPPPATGDPLQDLRAFARAHRRLLTDHPWAVAPLFTSPSPGLNAVRIGEHALAILRGGGFSDADAVAAFSGVIALNYGWASFTTARELDPSGPSHDVTAMLEALPAAEFPLTASVAQEMGAYGSEAHYELVLGALVDGLASAAAPPPGE
jgi:AcrR family transcriptional regulator